MVRTCAPDTKTFVSHTAPIPPCCPVSGNPKAGSTIRVSYLPRGVVVPVEALEERVRGYVGGFESIRGMEEMVQDIARWCAAETGVRVRAVADLIIQPPYGGELQTMRVSARADAIKPGGRSTAMSDGDIRANPHLRGQRAYEASVAAAPLYHDGNPRKMWDQLSDLERWSWERPVTMGPRDAND